MSLKIGKLYTCDMCGKSEFIRYKLHDDFVGYPTVGDFEKTVEPWYYVPQLGDLCSSCFKKYLAMLEDFKEDFHE